VFRDTTINPILEANGNLYINSNNIYVSKDLGETWSFLPGYSARGEMAIHDNTLYITSNSGLVVYNLSNATYTTITNASHGILDDNVRKVSTDSQGRILINTHDGLSISSDFGTTCTNYTNATIGIGANDVNEIKAYGNCIYLLTNNGIIISADNGTSWNSYDSSDGFQLIMLVQL